MLKYVHFIFFFLAHSQDQMKFDGCVEAGWYDLYGVSAHGSPCAQAGLLVQGHLPCRSWKARPGQVITRDTGIALEQLVSESLWGGCLKKGSAIAKIHEASLFLLQLLS